MTVQLRPARTAKAVTGTIAHAVLIGPHSLLSDAPKAAGGDTARFPRASRSHRNWSTKDPTRAFGEG